MEKAIFISSTGGHLTELLKLSTLFKYYDYKIITEKKGNENLKTVYGNKLKFLVYGTKHNMVTYPFIFSFNIFISLFYFIIFRPKYIITTGTHTAVPMCFIGKLFRKKVVFIETFANYKTKTVAGKIVYKIADLFIVQHKEMVNL